MSETKDNAYIETWVNSNQTRLDEIKGTNPALYGAVNGVLNYLNNYLGNPNPIVFEEPVITQIEESINIENWKASDFFKTKIYVDTPEKSKRFQKLIFELGGYWINATEPKETKYEQLEFLFVDKNLNLGYANTRNYFDKDPFKEVFYDDIFPQNSGKFKIGDKVKIPTSKMGVAIDSLNYPPASINTALSKNQDFLYITSIDKDNEITLSSINENGGDIYSLEQDNIQLYIAPEPKFKIGEKVVRINGKQVMTIVNQIYDVKQKMFDYDLELGDGTDVSLFENQLEAISTQPVTAIDPNNFQWEQIWGSGLTPESLVDKYKEYVKNKGAIASTKYDTEQLIESFGTLSVIVDTYSNTKNYDEAYNYFMKKMPSSRKERWNIWKFELKPEFAPIFKDFKKIVDAWEMNNALIYKLENRSKFIEFLGAFLINDLLYNSLTIPDLILGKKTNSIVVTEEEQEDFDDLLDQLDNLDL